MCAAHRPLGKMFFARRSGSPGLLAAVSARPPLTPVSGALTGRSALP